MGAWVRRWGGQNRKFLGPLKSAICRLPPSSQNAIFRPRRPVAASRKKARVQRDFFAHGKGRGRSHAKSVKIGPKEKSHAGGVIFSGVSFFPAVCVFFRCVLEGERCVGV